MCIHIKFVCFREGGWLDSWYKAAKNKVPTVFKLTLIYVDMPQQELLTYFPLS